jgi:hypothetical protein
MRRLVTAMTSLALIGSLGGCVETTQQKSAGAKLTADRILASQQPVRVTRANPQVAVLGVASVTHGSASAISVLLRNNATRPLTDLPISVGVHIDAGHRTVLVNGAAGLPYFQTHIGGIAPGATTSWVFTDGTRLPAGTQPFARVGTPTVDDQTGATTVPTLTATGIPGRGGLVRAVVTNHSSVAQLGLAIYASATSGRHLLAAGHVSLVQLAAGQSATVAVPVVGVAGPARIALDAPPTNLG